MSAPSASISSGSTCEKQPHTAVTAPGLSPFRRLIAWRDFLPLSAVTAQVFMITTSASPASVGS